MSNTDASENNVESPSTYGEEGYKEYRKRSNLRLPMPLPLIKKLIMWRAKN